MSVLQEAKDFIINRVFEPGLSSDKVSGKIKNVINNQRPWVNSFAKVGDLYQYLEHTASKDYENEAYQQLTGLGLDTYESVLGEFRKRFNVHLNDKTLIKDFLINNEYSARELLSPLGKYDTRLGGIQLNKVNGLVTEIVIKATLNNGKYPNQWLSENKLLKYYLKSMKQKVEGFEEKQDVFKESFEDNTAIINSANTPIYTFVRNTDSGPFTYKGVFKSLGHITDTDGKMWFQLAGADTDAAMSTINHQKSFQDQVKKSLADSSAERKKRLKKAAKKPKPKARVVTTTVYDRNPDVVADVLERANGFCEAENCKTPNRKAPFIRRKDDTPYLEVHHKIRLADGGDDTVDNAIALCPNCHRQEHFG